MEIKYAYEMTRKTAETAGKFLMHYLRFSQNSAMTTSGLRKPCGTCNFQARFNYLA